MPARAWRLLITEPADGATNMAIDEAIWRSRQSGASPPTVRFFAWAPPTVSLGYGQPLDQLVDVTAWRRLGGGVGPRAPRRVSLGYGQPLDQLVDVTACRRLGVGIVRRLTGGSAIYHDGPERELTYSVAAAAEDVGGGARDLLHS